MIPSLTSLPKASLSLEKNVWADFIELLCLTDVDKEISLSDIQYRISGEKPDAPGRGHDETGEQEDVLYRKILDIYSHLENRAQLLGDAYPFTFIDEDTICLSLEEQPSQKLFYLFLLYCSNLSFFEKTNQNLLTREFEVISKYALQQIFPSFHVEVFGTASNPDDLFHGGKLIERFEKLAKCLHTEVKLCTKKSPRYQNASGDGGLDLVGFMQLEDDEAGSPFIPVCFAQCACSVDKWKEKQGSIKFDTWNQRFEQLSHYCEFIFVPFSLRGPDGKWCDADMDHMVVIPIDRIRFLHIAKNIGNNMQFFEESNAYKVIQEAISNLQYKIIG